MVYYCRSPITELRWNRSWLHRLQPGICLLSDLKLFHFGANNCFTGIWFIFVQKLLGFGSFFPEVARWFHFLVPKLQWAKASWRPPWTFLPPSQHAKAGRVRCGWDERDPIALASWLLAWWAPPLVDLQLLKRSSVDRCESAEVTL